MSAPLVLGFNDFKRLCKDKRVYYYRGEDYYDFQFLVDGTLIKTTISENEIEDKERFFSDYMFAGATEIKFRIPNPKNDISFSDLNVREENPFNVIEEYQSEETKNIDIQREGIIEE